MDRTGVYEHGLSSAIRITHFLCTEVLLSDLQQRGRDKDRESRGGEFKRIEDSAETSCHLTADNPI